MSKLQITICELVGKGARVEVPPFELSQENREDAINRGISSNITPGRRNFHVEELDGHYVLYNEQERVFGVNDLSELIPALTRVTSKARQYATSVQKRLAFYEQVEVVDNTMLGK